MNKINNKRTLKKKNTEHLPFLKRIEKKSNSREFIFCNNSVEKRNISGNIIISTVNSIEDFKDFYKTPWYVYKDDKNWVAPLWIEYKDFFKKTNPFWSHADTKLFIANRKHETVGRIAAIIDYLYCKTYDKKIGFFGFFESIEDFNCAEALFQSAQDWLISKKMSMMRGPIDGRVDIGCGFLKNNFNSRPCLLSSYSPAYYISFAEKFDMKKGRDLLLYYIDLTKPIPKKLQEKAQKCKSSGIKIRKFNRLRTKKELKWWIELLLQTFSDHWGYVPISPEEVKTRFGIKQLRWFLDSNLFLIAELKGNPVAYIWSTPDYNQIFQKMNGRLGLYQFLQFMLMKRQINIGKLPLIGIKKEYRNQNIGSYLNYLTLVEMKKRGYIGAEVGWIDERNTAAHSTISITGAKLYKKLCVFDKNLSIT